MPVSGIALRTDEQPVVGLEDGEARIPVLRLDGLLERRIAELPIRENPGGPLVAGAPLRIERRVQKGDVRRIEIAFQRLRVVALEELLGDELAAHRQLAPAEIRWSGRLCKRPHVSPHDPVALRAPIRRGPQLFPVIAVGWPVRHLEAASARVELPAMVDAAQSAFFVAPEEQRGPAVRAVRPQQPDPAGAVAKRDQVLAQRAHAQRRAVRLGQLGAQQHRLPILAHQVAHRRARADAGQKLVVFPAQHSMIL